MSSMGGVERFHPSFSAEQARVTLESMIATRATMMNSRSGIKARDRGAFRETLAEAERQARENYPNAPRRIIRLIALVVALTAAYCIGIALASLAL